MKVNDLKLKKGDKIAAVSLSWGGPGKIPDKYYYGKNALQNNFGVEVVEMPHALSDPDFLYYNPKARADDLMQAFSDPDIKAIISTIGGDDSVRILPYLDKKIIQDNPKIFMGYSDTTIVLLFTMQLGIPCFYGPAIMSGFGENAGLHASFASSVQENLFGNKDIVYTNPTDGWVYKQHKWSDSSKLDLPRELHPPLEWIVIQGKGSCSGRLIGGCLEVLDMLKGTEYWPEMKYWQDSLIFFETSEECPSVDQVIRSLRWYQLTGHFDNARGIIFGRWGGTDDLELYQQYEDKVREFFTMECGRPDLLVMSRLQFGHTDPMVILPYGAEAMLNSDDSTLSIKALS